MIKDILDMWIYNVMTIFLTASYTMNDEKVIKKTLLHLY